MISCALGVEHHFRQWDNRKYGIHLWTADIIVIGVGMTHRAIINYTKVQALYVCLLYVLYTTSVQDKWDIVFEEGWGTVTQPYPAHKYAPTHTQSVWLYIYWHPCSLLWPEVGRPPSLEFAWAKHLNQFKVHNWFASPDSQKREHKLPAKFERASDWDGAKWFGGFNNMIQSGKQKLGGIHLGWCLIRISAWHAINH